MGNLNLTTMTATQTGKYSTSNAADAEIENALTEEITSHDASSSITVSASEFEGNFHHVIGGTSVGAFNFTVPATKRPFMVTNGAAHVATVKQATGTTVDIQPGDTHILYSGAAGIYDFGGPEISPNLVNDIGSIGGGTQDIDLLLGSYVEATVDTSETTFTFSNPQASGKEHIFRLVLTNGGSQTVNWPAGLLWDGGTEPTLTAAGVDYLAFHTIDGGTTWYGINLGLNFS